MKGAGRSTLPEDASTARATEGSEEARSEARRVERPGAFWAVLLVSALFRSDQGFSEQ